MRNSDPIDALSVIARQCVAVTCLERFCRQYEINHIEITRFIEHVWKVTQVKPETWIAWERGFSALPISGLGDPWPEDVENAMSAAILLTLKVLVEHVLETSASTWYGGDLSATKVQLQATLAICKEHAVQAPDLGLYLQPGAQDHGGWGPPLTTEELNAWRALV